MEVQVTLQFRSREGTATLILFQISEQKECGGSVNSTATPMIRSCGYYKAGEL